MFSGFNVAAAAGSGVFWMIVAAFCACCAIFAMQTAALGRAGGDPADFLQGLRNVLAEGHVEEALAICDETATPAARLAALAIRHRDEAREALLQRMGMQRRAEMSRVQRRLTAIALIAQCSPLAGLFGAVAGVARTAAALNTDSVVAHTDMVSGIVAALTCIAAGLVATIAAQTMYGILAAQADRMDGNLETCEGEIAMMLAPAKECGQ